MARVKTKDLSEYTRQLMALGGIAECNRVCKVALFDGAAVLADAVKEEIEALPVDNKAHGSPDHPINTVTSVEKAGLRWGFGIAPMRRDDVGWTTSAGFDGYNLAHTEKFPNGQPNAMIAASVENGTSWRTPNHFITRALRKAREKAQAAMAASADSTIKSIMEES